jgi:beta-lactamase regulating signal transducer with metallopeptidase domain/peptidoglycan/xylan/chitin deacetylase (PgdA/CDA1 family)
MTLDMIHAAISSQPLLRAVGWALLHSLWQGALVALLYACLSALLKESAAGVRHLAGCVALLLTLALPVATATIMLRSGVAASAVVDRRAGVATQGAAGGREEVDIAPDAMTPSRLDARPGAEGAAETLSARVNEGFASLAPWLVIAWMMGVALCATRSAWGLLCVRRLRQSGRPVAAELQASLARLARRMRVTRAVRLCESALVEAPTVIGHLKPVILLPACALTGLTRAQLEAALAHELAHIRRHDYLFNLLQTIIETLLFYHPAAWWLSRRVRAEREHACDDMAVAGVGDVILYARALAALEQLRPTRGPALALAANGGSLMRRIKRLVNHRTARARTSPGGRLAAAVALVLTIGLGLCVARALAPVSLSGDIAARSAHAAPASGARREVAVTFVNFPGNNIYSDERLMYKTRKLIRGLKAHGIQSVAFVNEGRLYKDDGALDETRVGLLREWLDAGHELGNETFSHLKLYGASLADFQANVERGEQVMSKLVAERGGRLRYFSYPYLNTGADAEQKAAAEKYLRGRGYQIHPVTIDNMDWLFNRAYLEALRREDEAAAARIRAEYVPYMEGMFEFFESYSREVMGREFPQVLMLTAGALNADCIEDLASTLERRGYRFVTMEQATKDEAYSLPDAYTGARGDSWIARWAVTKGMEYKDAEERLPPFMQHYFAEFLAQQRAATLKPAGGRK